MSQTPPQMPGNPYQFSNSGGPGDGFEGPAKGSGMALAALILGIFSILCPGLIFSVLAIVFGIIALNKINRDPLHLTGKGQAIGGIVTGVVSLAMIPVVALLIAILLPSLGKARELSQRSGCAANQRGIMMALQLYASENGDQYPIVAQPGGYGLAAAGSGKAGATSDEAINSMYKGPQSPSVTQNIWLVVVSGTVSPRQFICRSDPAVTTPASPLIGGNYATNFNDGRGPSDMTYSYSFAYPWTAAARRDAAGKTFPAGSVGPWWRDTGDAGLPLMADMAPLNGTGTPAATTGDGTTRYANSFNHTRDGQNVTYADTHVDFVRMAAVGSGGDNIYAGSRGTASPRGTPCTGTVPDIGTGGSAGMWDVCLVPAADANAGYMRK